MSDVADSIVFEYLPKDPGGAKAQRQTGKCARHQ